MSRERAKNYACPQCYAGVGEKCRRADGSERESVHASRINLVPTLGRGTFKKKDVVIVDPDKNRPSFHCSGCKRWKKEPLEKVRLHFCLACISFPPKQHSERIAEKLANLSAEHAIEIAAKVNWFKEKKAEKPDARFRRWDAIRDGKDSAESGTP